jgi:ABC-type transporter Mla subunit MlaD
MTIDERIEAIASNLDTLTKLHLDNDREYREIIGSLAATVGRMDTAVGRMDTAVEKLTAFAADVKDALRRLANIAGAHQDRLDDHERRLDDLES